MGRLEVKVVPGASREGVGGWLGGRLKVRVRQPPEKGRANAAVAALLADLLGVHPSAVRLVSGATTAAKSFEIDGLDADAIAVRLGVPPAPSAGSAVSLPHPPHER